MCPVTNQGKSGMALLLGGFGGSPNFGAIGTGTTAFAGGQTGLILEVKRNAITGSADTSVLFKTTFSTFFPTTDITGTTPVTEVAMFTGASGTFEMWNREVFSSVTKDDTIELTFEQTYEIF